MSLLRFAARSALASVFVVRGLQAVKEPAALTPITEPVTDTVVPLLQKYTPSQVGSLIPSDSTTLVRIGGIAQIAAAGAFALGLGRRTAAGLLALSTIPSLLASSPLGARFAGKDVDLDELDRGDLLTNTALFGALLIAANDTEGRPSLAYRTEVASKKAGRKAEKTRKKIAGEVKHAQKSAKKTAKKVSSQLS